MKHPKDMTDDELRVATAVEVFGWREDRDDDGTLWGFVGDDAPWGNDLDRWHPERDWSAAGAVVEKMGHLGFSMSFQWKGAHRQFPNSAEVSFSKAITTDGHAASDSAPRAICEAAVMAVRAKGGAE